MSNQELNINRNYRFKFFRIIGENTVTIQPINDEELSNSLNFSFSYNVSSFYSNTIQLIFYNLNQKQISLFTENRVGFSLSIWYGYDNNVDTDLYTIFTGSALYISTYRQGPDIITQVTATDLMTSLIGKNYQKTYPKGTSSLKIIKDSLTFYGSSTVMLAESEQYLTKIYQSPKTISGSIYTIIQDIAQDSGLLFSVQNNIVAFMPSGLDQYLKSVPVQIINNTNGLIGYPRATGIAAQLAPTFYGQGINLNQKIGVISISTLIRRYKLYTKIYLESEFFKGYYGILSVSYSGEWRGNNWQSNLTLYPLGSQ